MLRFFIIFYLSVLSSPAICQTHKIYISNRGNDNNTGTFTKPLKTLKRALLASERFSGKQVSIQLRGGTYYLPETVVIRNPQKLPAQLEISPFDNEKVIISAGRRIKADWQLFKNGIYRTSIPPGITFERLYVNGKLQNMARYPNADTNAGIFNGTAADAVFYVRVLSWGNPFGGYLHALDEQKKGSLHYRITGVDDTDNVELEGGWQFSKPVHPDKSIQFVENIFAELDTPGEWYFDKQFHFLYFKPEGNMDLAKAIVEAANLNNSIELLGTVKNPIKNVVIKNLHFRHNERTFMESRTEVPDSDWNVYKGGALLLSGTENCRIENCSFTDLGGNAIMLSGYNKDDTIEKCLVDHAGASAVSFIANDKAENEFSTRISIHSNDFHHVGTIEKQGSGIHLSGAKQIEIKDNKIHHSPGSAIKSDNISAQEITSNNNTVSNEFMEINPR